jgi:hypothetical protein
MGTSTDAILVYGIPLEEDAIDEYGEPSEGEEDTNSLPSRMAFMGDTIDGVRIAYHCSNKCTMHIAAAAGTERRARRGYPVEIDPASLAVDPVWAPRLETFVAKHNLQTMGKPPGWYLVSYWG